MARKRSHKRKHPKRNPSMRGFSKRAGGAIFGLKFREALSGLMPTQVGMWATKFAAKLGNEENRADVADPGSWNYASYIKGALGGIASAIVLNMVRPGLGQKALEGSLNLVTFFALRNEVIEGNESAVKWLGEDVNTENLLPESAEDIVYEGEDGPVFLGEDGEWYPADDRHRLLGAGLEPIGPLGSTLEPVSHMGGTDSTDVYQRTWRRT